MKPILAWLLLALVSFQWIGGHVYFRISNFVEHTFQMSETEHTISELLEAETGIETDIEIIEVHPAQLEDIGYSNTFIFTKKIDGEEVDYTIKTNTDFQEQETLYGGENHHPDNSKSKILGKLFSPLFYQDIFILLPKITIEYVQSSFRVAILRTLFKADTPSPPPNV